MRVIRDICESTPSIGPAVVTVGSFDGVHLGHVHLLGELRSRARERGWESVVVTFSEHPRGVIEPNGELRELTSLGDKERLIAEQGVDVLVVLPFDEMVRGLTAEEFVRDILVARLGVAELVVGYNHRLGRDRAGDAWELRRLGLKYGFDVHEASKFELSGVEKVSSTAIRAALKAGDRSEAEKILGRKIL